MAGRRLEKDGESAEVDHYCVLGLPSGEAGISLTLKEIERAYRNQSRIRHPDKRPDDPNATADFQRLTASFEILRDESARATFDARIRARADRARRDTLRDTKRRSAAADLDERERAAAAGEVDDAELARRREKSVAAELQRELAEFQAKKARKATPDSSISMSDLKKEEQSGRRAVDKERVLKVSWDKQGSNYTYSRLNEIFQKFGEIEDIVISSKASKKKGSALIVMYTKEAAVAATHTVCGDISNPLLVLLASPNSTSNSRSDTTGVDMGNIMGAGFNNYEASILEKLRKKSAGV